MRRNPPNHHKWSSNLPFSILNDYLHKNIESFWYLISGNLIRWIFTAYRHHTYKQPAKRQKKKTYTTHFIKNRLLLNWLPCFASWKEHFLTAIDTEYSSRVCNKIKQSTTESSHPYQDLKDDKMLKSIINHVAFSTFRNCENQLD